MPEEREPYVFAEDPNDTTDWPECEACRQKLVPVWWKNGMRICPTCTWVRSLVDG